MQFVVISKVTATTHRFASFLHDLRIPFLGVVIEVRNTEDDLSFGPPGLDAVHFSAAARPWVIPVQAAFASAFTAILCSMETYPVAEIFPPRRVQAHVHRYSPSATFLGRLLIHSFKVQSQQNRQM